MPFPAVDQDQVGPGAEFSRLQDGGTVGSALRAWRHNHRRIQLFEAKLAILLAKRLPFLEDNQAGGLVIPAGVRYVESFDRWRGQLGAALLPQELQGFLQCRLTAAAEQCVAAQSLLGVVLAICISRAGTALRLPQTATSWRRWRRKAARSDRSGQISGTRISGGTIGASG